MKLTVLTENTALREGLKAEHGLSVYIEKGDIKMLFDAGERDALKVNSKVLGVDLREINTVAFSHNHVDHCGGFLQVADCINPDCAIYLHRGFDTRKWWDHRFDPPTDPTAAQNLELVGPAMPLEYFFLRGKYGMRLIDDDMYRLGENIWLVSGFPVQRGIEAVFPASRMEDSAGSLVVDEFRDEQACVIKCRRGLVVLTGCAHNGIMNILETVKRHFPNERIHTVLGGTHLVPYNRERVKATVEYFEKSGIAQVGACHCTGPAIADFSDKLSCYIKTGAGLTLEFED